MFSLMKLRLKHIFLYVPPCLPARLRKINNGISEIEKDQQWDFRKWENSHSYIWRSNIWLCMRDMSRWAVFAWTNVWQVLWILKLLILIIQHYLVPQKLQQSISPPPALKLWSSEQKSCKHIIKIATENTTYHRFVCLHQIKMHFSDILKWILMAGKDQEWQICASKFNTNRFTTITKPKTLFPSVV